MINVINKKKRWPELPRQRHQVQNLLQLRPD